MILSSQTKEDLEWIENTKILWNSLKTKEEKKPWWYFIVRLFKK